MTKVIISWSPCEDMGVEAYLCKDILTDYQTNTDIQFFKIHILYCQLTHRPHQDLSGETRVTDLRFSS